MERSQTCDPSVWLLFLKYEQQPAEITADCLTPSDFLPVFSAAIRHLYRLCFAGFISQGELP